MFQALIQPLIIRKKGKITLEVMGIAAASWKTFGPACNKPRQNLWWLDVYLV